MVRKRLFVFVSVVVACVAVVSAVGDENSKKGMMNRRDSNCGDGLTCTIDNDHRRLTISGDGSMYNFDPTSLPWTDSRSYFDTIVVNEGVKSIGDYAFYECRNIRSVSLPESLTSIGQYAFGTSTAIESLTVNGETAIGDHAFDGCQSLRTITFGENVQSIGNYAFYDCRSFNSLTIPDGVTSIGDYAFDECQSLNSLTLGNSLTSIGSYAFKGCNKISKIVIPSRLAIIGKYAFSYCNGLQSFEVKQGSENFAAIDGVLFNKENTSLVLYPVGRGDRNYIIPDNVTTIENDALTEL